MKKTIRYKCDFCERTSGSARVIFEHEKHCTFNPANRACRTCAFCEQENGHPGCDLGEFEHPTDRNPYGLRIHCDCWRDIEAPEV
ncbi:MAG: hypothetical protein VB042_10515 [Victivallaceae bacterium]|nr:hypothetical protein [Victivallaceae bacterium]